MQQWWFFVGAGLGVLMLMIGVVTTAFKKPVEGDEPERFRRLRGLMLYGGVIIFFLCVIVAGLFPYQNEEEAAAVRDFVETTLEAKVHNVDTANTELEVELREGCIYKMSYIPAPNDEFAVVAGTEVPFRATPVFTPGGVAYSKSLDECPQQIWEVPGHPTTTTSTTTPVVAP